MTRSSVDQPGPHRREPGRHPTRDALAPTDGAHFRRTLGNFATGVTIVATRQSGGAPVGLTVSSFNSLSLDPPLILWSLVKGSSTLEAFQGSPFFAVSVLAVGQADLAARFASRIPDRFAGVPIHDGLTGAPLIDGAVAWFECERTQMLSMGDHWLFIGEVKHCASGEGQPLIFRGGEFARAGALNHDL